MSSSRHVVFPTVDRPGVAHHHPPDDSEYVHCSAVEKSSPSGDCRSTRAIDFSPSTDRKTPPSGRGFLLSRLRLNSRRWTMTELRSAYSRTSDLRLPDPRLCLHGLWLPLVTPFRNGELDEASLRRLVRHYASGPVDGLILAATSGEGMSLGAHEFERLGGLTHEEIKASGRRLPVR